MAKQDVFSTITPKMVLGQLFKSRNIMHLVHLKTDSFAIHKATEKYFKGILDLTDQLAEVHFGLMGKKDIEEIPAASYIEPKQHLNDLYYYMNGNRKLFTTSHEQNIIDEIMTLINRTQYLLTLD